eukprot:Rhum_TRINITY_DN14770_c3_g1::Rhum_TRINITY_DN14770_c3_g1_i1::g.115706::m.115706/K00476/ASPH; aspartate beta-hydroxylase
MKAAMVKRGLAGPEQYVTSYVPGLTARPVWSAAQWGAHAGLAAAARLLREAAPRLAEEFARIEAAGLMEADSECLSDAWRRYEVDPPWRRGAASGAAACRASPTPVACELMAALRAVHPVTRAGYSTITAGAHIRPHYGSTNGQLKFHLGLEVPAGNCAVIRVRDERVHWTTGDVVMIDDSFQHEVFNRCGERRTVFQVVLRHPDLPATTQ